MVEESGGGKGRDRGGVRNKSEERVEGMLYVMNAREKEQEEERGRGKEREEGELNCRKQGQVGQRCVLFE